MNKNKTQKSTILDVFLIFFKDGLESFINISKDVSMLYDRKFLGIVSNKHNQYRQISQYEYSVFCFIYYFRMVRYSFFERDIPLQWLRREIDKCILKKDINSLFFFDRILTTEKMNSIDQRVIDIKSKVKKSLIDIGISKIHSVVDFNSSVQKKKIVIVAGLFQHSIKALHATMVKNYAETLLEYDKDCQVVVINTNEIPFSLYDFDFKSFRMKEGILKEIDKLFIPILQKYGDRFEFFNLRPKLKYHQDMDYLLETISQINPSLLMFYGSPDHNESYFIRQIFYAKRPIVYFFSQVSNWVDENNDVYLARSKLPLLGKYDVSKVLYAPNPMLKEIQHDTHEKYVLSKPKNEKDIYLISVLSGDRLYNSLKEMSVEEMSIMFDIIESNNVKWYFVGVEDKTKIYSLSDDFKKYEIAGKIIFITLEKNLLGLLEWCDIFVHFPNISGGAGGVEMALSKKLLVLNSNYNDAAEALPKEVLIEKNDFHSFFTLLNKVIVDENIRNELKDLCFQHYSNRSQNERMKAIFNGFDMAINNFNSRTN